VHDSRSITAGLFGGGGGGGGGAEGDVGFNLVQAAFSVVLAPSLCSVSSGVLRKLRDGFYLPLKGACPACLEEVSIIMEDGTREVRTVAELG
jgi:hypothetical protein